MLARTTLRPVTLVYAAEDSSLRAVPFDTTELEVTGNPVPLVEGVKVKASGAANFSISDNGRLVYTLDVGGGSVQQSLVWVDREGREEPIAAPLRGYHYPRLSPDGAQVALDVREPEADIWIWDFRSQRLRKLTFDAAQDIYPHWMPDGERVVFNSSRSGLDRIYLKRADGVAPAERVTETDAQQGDESQVNAVAPDGSFLIARRRFDLVVVSLQDDRGIESLVSSEFREQERCPLSRRKLDRLRVRRIRAV